MALLCIAVGGYAAFLTGTGFVYVQGAVFTAAGNGGIGTGVSGALAGTLPRHFTQQGE